MMARNGGAARSVTIEGLAQRQSSHPLQPAFLNHDALQCGFCTPGQIMSAVACLHEPRPEAGRHRETWRESVPVRCVLPASYAVRRRGTPAAPGRPHE